jgi:hypothetical protein
MVPLLLMSLSSTFWTQALTIDFALIEIVDCTDQMAKEGKKCLKYLSSLVQPLIRWLEEMARSQFVDLIMFDDARNVRLAGKIIAQHHPHITMCHGAEHVIALFFSDVYNTLISVCLYFSFLTLGITNCCNNCSRTGCSLQEFVNFLQAMQEYLGVHLPWTPFNVQKIHKKHNKGTCVGFIKPSKCQMGGELIYPYYFVYFASRRP